ncbi:MAG: nitroreductase family protein [Candidatus Omnitrophota bacterium]
MENEVMETRDCIKKRRSVRKFTASLPQDADIAEILEAGRWAPSGLNNQPWRFLVIKGQEQKDGLLGFTKYAAIIQSAPCVIVVCMDNTVLYNRDKDLMAMGACIQNMLLAACSLGLGACWLGEILNKKQEVAGFLKLDADLEVMAVVALGYPDEQIRPGSRKPLKNLLAGA